MTDVATQPQQPAVSARRDRRFAGWACDEKGTFTQLEAEGERPKFSWLRPTVLWAARNDRLARRLGDPTDEVRRKWIEAQLARGVDRDFRIERPDLGDSFSCLIAGDTGEGDHSQYAVVPGLLKAGEGTSFLVTMSDVIYPIGDVNDYLVKFFRPYRDYPAAIYGVPGNHDWYDGLGGFMRHFCDAEPLAGPRPTPVGFKGRLRERLWRAPSVLGPKTLEECRALRPAEAQQGRLPGPYWALDAGPIRFVGIDTGIMGHLDGDQGDWLRRISADTKPKILLTGKPIYVDNEHHPGRIADRDFTVDDVVRDPANRYIAAVGGDIHNYQRYPVPVDGRTIQYIVAGGGGAFMHATHTIPKVDVGGISEDDFRCYPLRGDSLAFYSRLYSRKLTFSRLLEIGPERASALLAERLRMTPTRESPARPSRATRIKGTFVGLLPSGKTFHKYLSELADWDDPPLFKSFLRLDVSPGAVRIRCFGATGCRAQEIEPPVEDDFTITLPA
jgi:Calcineurin-like phosphoesterase